MDHVRIIKQAWSLLWRWRSLWLLGFVIALTGVSWEGATLYRMNVQDENQTGRIYLNYKNQGETGALREGDVILNINPPGEFSIELPQRDQYGSLESKTFIVTPQEARAALWASGILIAALLLLLLAGLVLRYVALSGLIWMVNENAAQGARPSLRQGLHKDWSRSAWRLFLIDLLVAIAAALLVGLLVLAVVVPVFLFANIFSAGLFFPLLGALILGFSLVALLVRFIRRACVLEDLGVFASIAAGFRMVAENARDAGGMWLLMIGLGYVWRIALVLLVVTFFPAVIAVILGGVAIGAVPAALSYALSSQFMSGILPWVFALLVGLPVFVLVVAAPFVFLGGLWEVFASSVWTLTYRELHGAMQPVRHPAPQVVAGSA